VARVLLVDDDDDLQLVLGRYLEHDGHEVVAARSGREALDRLREGADLVLLDLTLPDLDGLEVLRRLRADGYDQPVLVLTARGEEKDRLLGFGLGADDYIVKPFSPREVCLRVGVWLRRTGPPAAGSGEGELSLGALSVLPEEHRVRVGGREVSLTPREFELLLLLVRHPRRVVHRSVILDSLWAGEDVSDHVLDQHVASLRRKLGPAVTITTVRGVGYRLEPGEGDA
jgi:DNA-binding response OmpR family regulator